MEKKLLLIFVFILNTISVFAYGKVEKSFFNNKVECFSKNESSLIPKHSSLSFYNNQIKETKKQNLLLGNKGKKQRKNVIQLNILPLVFNSYNLFYERKIESKLSVVLAMNYFHSKSGFFKYYDSRWFSATFDFRRYFSSSLNGLFVSPYFKYKYVIDYQIVNDYWDPSLNLTIETPIQDEHWHFVGFGLTAGYQWVYNNGISLGIFTGGGYYPVAVLITNNPDYTHQKFRIDLRAAFTAGFAF